MRTVRVAKLDDLKPAVEAHAVGDAKRTVLYLPDGWKGQKRITETLWTETIETMVKSKSKSR